MRKEENVQMGRRKREGKEENKERKRKNEKRKKNEKKAFVNKESQGIEDKVKE